jgi:YcxB-like protein
MNEAIAIEVQYSEDEFVRGIKFANRRAKKGIANSVFYFILSLVTYTLVYVLLLRRSEPWNRGDAVLLTFAVLFALLVAYLLKDFNLLYDLNLSKFYRSSPLLREMYRIDFNEDGITSTSDSVNSELKWTAITEATESAHDFYFFSGPQQALIIPKRAFTVQQRSDIRGLSKKMLSVKANFPAIAAV